MVHSICERIWEPPVLSVRFFATSTGIARVLFTVEGDIMVLLHGFVKKSQKTPVADLMIAKQRLSDLKKR